MSARVIRVLSVIAIVNIACGGLAAVPTSAPLQTDDFLDQLARDTWRYLSSDWATDQHLPWSWRSATLNGGDYDNPTEIGLYALSWLAAYNMQRAWSPAWSQVEAEVLAVLDRLRLWQTGAQNEQPHGPNAYAGSVFYQWYWINWDPPVVGAGAGDHVVPSVDNALLAASLITIREYGQAHQHPAMQQRADQILRDMDFTLWYHDDTHLFAWGAPDDPLGGGAADYYSNENRIINFVARALGQLNADEYRASLDALAQNSGTYANITVDRVAWDGSLFTYLMPALFIQEPGTAYGTHTLVPAIEAQIAYAQDQGYGAWGLSDCFDIAAGGYIQQGAPPAAGPDAPETHPGVVAPYASALALITPLASEALTNLQNISTTFPAAYVAPYGFRDGVMVKLGDAQYGVPSERFSALAQEWIFLAIANSETRFVWNYFYRDAGVRLAHIEMYGAVTYLPIIVKS
jgi:hypothetical protein